MVSPSVTHKLKKRILVVDDDEGIRHVLESALFRAGFNVSVAATGMHALQKLKGDSAFDLILCDFKIPMMNGLEFQKKLIEAGIDIPIIFMSGYFGREQIVQLNALKIPNIISKPFKIPNLVEQIHIITMGLKNEKSSA
jgi:CheY-like chemotaxis protein